MCVIRNDFKNSIFLVLEILNLHLYKTFILPVGACGAMPTLWHLNIFETNKVSDELMVSGNNIFHEAWLILKYSIINHKFIIENTRMLLDINFHLFTHTY